MLSNSKKSAGGVIVVTGAGKGLGKALCLKLTQQGHRVAAFSRAASSIDDMTQSLPDDQFLAVTVDVVDPAAVAAGFDDVRQKMGPVSALINNAAVYPRRDILDETYESFMHTVAVNLGGMVACTQEALKDMVAAGEGRIINVTSYAGCAPAPASAAYSVSKGATRIFTNALLADLGDRFPKIVINEWLPGQLNTDMGIPDGIAPAQAASWGAKLIEMKDPAVAGLVFDRDRSVPPPAGFKRRVLNRLLRRQARVVHLG
ncbi:SDR family oxidoreductase [Yoonia sp. F2084L]|uniref:SDR family oxidoreductase n=1 Tax=Yoonia sp. F2084L TaxID=2926419 RepID=UPI001FF123E8|nr:SDR family oxidoreductase [Yoonia sp. F2084L]MCK0093979.1 SDR family oxidoreductase [Yoonia sp. F2084L]